MSIEWEELARQGEIKEAIGAFVRRSGGISFVELVNQFAQFTETRGDIALTLGEDENLILWVNLSQAFADNIRAAIVEKLIFPHPTQLLVYLVDGETLSMPVAKRISKNKVSPQRSRAEQASNSIPKFRYTNRRRQMTREATRC